MITKNPNPKTLQQMLPAIISGIFASICWIIGDILLVGFTPAPELYPLLSETYASNLDVDLATLMLSGSTNRLMWGALIAVFSMPFYLYSIFSVAQLLKRKFMMPVFILLLIGYSYMPLGHAGFFYVGEIYKTILATDVVAHARLLETAGGFVKILSITWMASIGITAIGWLVFGIFVWQGKTVLKRSAILLNPILLTLIFVIISKLLPSPAGDYIGCAIFNEANLVFFVVLLVVVLKKKKSKTNQP